MRNQTVETRRLWGSITCTSCASVPHGRGDHEGRTELLQRVRTGRNRNEGGLNRTGESNTNATPQLPNDTHLQSGRDIVGGDRKDGDEKEEGRPRRGSAKPLPRGEAPIEPLGPWPCRANDQSERNMEEANGGRGG